ncbi:MAG: hypothetical protein R3E87_10965 [Burkholderiaceae bacterium]
MRSSKSRGVAGVLPATRRGHAQILGLVVVAVAGLVAGRAAAQAQSGPPIFDVHIHYSHDAVELTPPRSVIALMREAHLSRALVSSSDARGTQALLDLAPDLIVPGLRPYRRRGETGTWMRDPQALAYVERLLTEHRWASIGEFHLYGADADLPIPRRLAELAVAHDLFLHAHSDADAVRRLLAAQPRVRVLWAHAGFADPDAVGAMLEAHDTLWADLAFRSDIGSDGRVDPRWRALFERFPERFMLGTDTYTPERVHYIPEHARDARGWLRALPAELAERIAWRNADALVLATWERSRAARALCGADDDGAHHLRDADIALAWRPGADIRVGEPFAVSLRICAPPGTTVTVDADMPAHGHGMNYRPVLREGPAATDGVREFEVDGLLWHMPGRWRLRFLFERDGRSSELNEWMSLN